MYQQLIAEINKESQRIQIDLIDYLLLLHYFLNIRQAK
jgi:hypothetical protein